MTARRVLVFATAMAALERPAWASGSEGAASPFAGDFGNALWTLIIFGLVVVVLGKFAWGPILSALQRREDFIRGSLEQAKKNREESELRLKEYSDKIVNARAEAHAVVEEGRRDAEVLKKKIEDAAKTEAAAMVERARREIGIATDTAIKDLYTLGAKLATEVASRIIQKEVDAKQHERLIQESITELSKVHSGGKVLQPVGRG